MKKAIVKHNKTFMYVNQTKTIKPQCSVILEHSQNVGYAVYIFIFLFLKYSMKTVFVSGDDALDKCFICLQFIIMKVCNFFNFKYHGLNTTAEKVSLHETTYIRTQEIV